MSDIKEILLHPYSLGLGTGLLVAAWVWVRGWLSRRGLMQEKGALRQHLHAQMEITAEGGKAVRTELENLRRQNENLRITVATLKNNPGRSELRTLHVYDKAVHLMYEKAPGFAPAWESVLREAESEIEKSDRGIVALVRKVFRPSLGTGGPGQKALPPGESGGLFAGERKDQGGGPAGP